MIAESSAVATTAGTSGGTLANILGKVGAFGGQVGGSQMGQFMGKGLGLLGGGNPLMGALTIGSTLFSAWQRTKANQDQIGVISNQQDKLDEAEAETKKLFAGKVDIVEEETEERLGHTAATTSYAREDISGKGAILEAGTDFAYAGEQREKVKEATERSGTAFQQTVDTLRTGLGKSLFDLREQESSQLAGFHQEGERLKYQKKALQKKTFISNIFDKGGYS